MKLLSLVFVACMVASLGAMDISKTYFKLLPPELKQELVKYILTSQRKECVYINSIQANPCIDIPLDFDPTCFWFDQGNNYLYIASNGKIECWNLYTKQLIKKIEVIGLWLPSKMVIDPASNQLIIVNGWCTLHVFDLTTNKCVFTRNFYETSKRGIYTLTLDSENKSVLVSFFDNTVSRLNLKDYNLTEIIFDNPGEHIKYMIIAPTTQNLFMLNSQVLSEYKKLGEDHYKCILKHDMRDIDERKIIAFNNTYDQYFIGGKNAGQILIKGLNQDVLTGHFNVGRPIGLNYDAKNDLLISAHSVMQLGVIQFWDIALKKCLHKYKLYSTIDFFSFDQERHQMIVLSSQNQKGTIKIIPFSDAFAQFLNQYLLSSKLYQCKIANRDLDLTNDPILLKIYLSIPPQQRVELEDEVRIIGQGITGGQAYTYSLLEAAKARLKKK